MKGTAKFEAEFQQNLLNFRKTLLLNSRVYWTNQGSLLNFSKLFAATCSSAKFRKKVFRVIFAKKSRILVHIFMTQMMSVLWFAVRTGNRMYTISPLHSCFRNLMSKFNVWPVDWYGVSLVARGHERLGRPAVKSSVIVKDVIS